MTDEDAGTPLVGERTDTDPAGGTGAGAPEPLVGDGVTPGIVRVGETVRRPVRPFSATVRAYLAHLHEAGFTDAPVPLGVDDQGREVLSFVPGDIPRNPLPAEATGDDVLVALAGLIRRLHDAAQGWEPPPDAVWGGIPGADTVDLPTVDEPAELVSHRDYCPGNVVFRDGLPAALIDFDLARPTTRLYDVVNALYWWVPLLDPRDRPPALAGSSAAHPSPAFAPGPASREARGYHPQRKASGFDAAHRVAVFADAYGLTGAQRAALVPLAARVIHRYHVGARAAARHDPVFRRMWERGVRDRMPRAEAWIAAEGPAIAERISGRRPV